MKDKISIINYGVGNVYSIVNAMLFLGFDCNVIVNPEEVRKSDRVILPGVGAFGPAMEKLKSNGLDQAICEFQQSGKNLLGICLGFQLLFDDSEENGLFQGLAALQGHVKNFDRLPNYPIPQIQWNKVDTTDKSKLFFGMKNELMYFLHSYYVQELHSSEYVVGKSSYAGRNYTSMVEAGNVFGVQFHPEKSGAAGLKLLNNFMRL